LAIPGIYHSCFTNSNHVFKELCLSWHTDLDISFKFRLNNSTKRVNSEKMLNSCHLQNLSPSGWFQFKSQFTVMFLLKGTKKKMNENEMSFETWFVIAVLVPLAALSMLSFPRSIPSKVMPTPKRRAFANWNWIRNLISY
jgi:hypothetical protein